MGFEWLAKPVVKYLGGSILILVLLGSFYAKGRGDGTAICEGNYAKDALVWANKVHDQELAFTSQIDFIAFQYNNDVTVLRNQVQYLKKHPEVITRYIPLAVDATLPKGFVDLHNKAAKGEDLDVPVENASAMTSRKLSEAAGVIGTNYSTCLAEKKQLAALQAVIKSYQAKQQELKK